MCKNFVSEINSNIHTSKKKKKKEGRKMINQTYSQHPLDGNHLDAVGELIQTKRFRPSASTRRAQLSVAVTTVRSTDLLNIMSSPESMLTRQD